MIDNRSTRYNFPWRLIRAAFSGKSVIDTPYLSIESIEEAEQFMRLYGYNWNKPADQEFLLDCYQKALRFVQEHFIAPYPEQFEIPEILLKCSDIRLLLYWSNPHAFHRKIQLWACALLRVLHTVLHLENDFLVDYFHEARTQIFERFDGHLYVDNKDRVYLGKDPATRIALTHFEVKKEKNWDSRLMKLLHKAENTAATIHDRIGVRIVTHNLTDVLCAFNYLATSRIFMLASIAPARSKNTLLDVDKYQVLINRLIRRLHNDQITLEDMQKELETALNREEYLLQNAKVSEPNPRSLEGFRAVQFTCRHLVRFENPVYGKLNHLHESMKTESISQEFTEQLLRIISETQREISFFFPFEIQIMDKLAWQDNSEGSGSHSEYKMAQTTVARARVLGKLLENKEDS